jgi:predicted DNA-binding transcriptional regulator AlpA
MTKKAPKKAPKPARPKRLRKSGDWVDAKVLADLLGVHVQTMRKLAKADPNFPKPVELGRYRKWNLPAVKAYWGAA